MAETTMAYGDPDPSLFWKVVPSDNTTFLWNPNLTAAAAPIAPPREWFEMPEAAGPTPLTFSDDGRVFGHLALWETCHRGFLNGQYSECVKAPRSQVDYSQFYAGGQLKTQEGDTIPVGRLTYDTSHASLTADLRAAARHYDSTGAVGAFVRARDGQHGIWLSGVVRSDLSPEGLRDLRANPPSGDWRLLSRGDLELVASLAVPVPGFPVTRSQLALAASADGGLEVTALILTGPTCIELEDMEGLEYDRDFLRQRHSLSREVGLTASVRSKDYLRKKKTISREWR